MTFRRLNDVSHLVDDFVCRESVWTRAIGTLIGLGFLGLVLWLPPLRGWWLGWVIAGFTALAPLAFASAWRKALGRQNRILRISGRNVLMKFRSFANAHFNPNDEVVVSFPQGEIAWVRERREKLLSASSEGGTLTQWFSYLELGLKNIDAALLGQRLAEERARRPPPARIETISRDYPVRLLDGAVLQIRWRGGSNCITPSIKKVLNELSRFALLRDPVGDEIDASKPGLTPEDSQSRILTLAERGEIIAATKLARECYGGSLAEAKQFVEELIGIKPRQSSASSHEN